MLGLRRKAAGVQEHGLRAENWEVVFNLEVVQRASGCVTGRGVTFCSP